MGRNEDLYAILGVSPSADAETIDHAYKELIKELHPDLATGKADEQQRTAASSRLNQAADILRDPTKRAVYDFDQAAARAAAYVAAARPPRQATSAPIPAPVVGARPPAPARSSAPSGAGHFLFQRRRAHGPLEWLRYSRPGQWLALFLVVVAASVLADLVSPADIGLFTTRVALVWLIIGNLATRNLANPAGDLLRAGFKAFDWMMDRYREQFVAKASH
jgi:hypothetical protein